MQNNLESSTGTDCRTTVFPHQHQDTSSQTEQNCHKVVCESFKNNKCGVSDIYSSDSSLVNKLAIRKHLWSADTYRKEQSPRVNALFKETHIQPVLDEGSEVNCISETFAKVNKVDFIPTNCTVSSADCSNMQILGQTTCNIIITLLHTSSIV